MLNKTGAGAQHPIRSHWMLRPSPQSYKNSKQQSKRYRANTITANSKTSATKQTTQQPQHAPPKPASPSPIMPSFSLAEESKLSPEVEPGAVVGRKGHPLFQPRHHPTRPPPCFNLIDYA